MSTDVDFRRLLGRLRLRHLELLAALGHDANLGRCAKRLSMTQPTASKLLREIEDIFATALFERNRRGLTPTPAGAVLTRRASLLLAETAAAHEELAATRQGAVGRLRLGVFPVAIHAFLPAVCHALEAGWPGIALALHEGIEDTLLERLEAGELDAVFGRVVPESLTPELHHELLYREPTVIVCGATNRLRHADADTLAAELADSRWALPAAQGTVYNLVAARLRQLGLPPPRVVHETSSVFITLELLRDPGLVSVLPQRVAQHYARTGQVAAIPLAEIASSYAVGVVYRRHAGRHPGLPALLAAARVAASSLSQTLATASVVSPSR